MFSLFTTRKHQLKNQFNPPIIIEKKNKSNNKILNYKKLTKKIININKIIVKKKKIKHANSHLALSNTVLYA